jgi:hypothetical protein
MDKETIIKIVTFVMWQLYASQEGWREAWYWHDKNTGKHINEKRGEHAFWSSQRFVVFCFTVYILGSLWYIIPCMGVFPFWHDGWMYLNRNDLDRNQYPDRFFDQSDESTAKSTEYFPPTVRIICLSFSVIIFCAILFLKINETIFCFFLKVYEIVF